MKLFVALIKSGGTYIYTYHIEGFVVTLQRGVPLHMPLVNDIFGEG
jgi:hypothetical protein